MLSVDVFARFCRNRGYDTLYICGTDEYGTATETKAIEEKKTPRELCDYYYQEHTKIYDWFHINFDKFGRTSNEQCTEITQELFTDLDKAGLINEHINKQLYCPKCNMFLADRYVDGTCPKCNSPKARGDQCDDCGALLDPIELKEPKCHTCGSTPEIRETKHLYIDLPKLSGKLDDRKKTTSDADKALQEAIDEVKEELSAAIENLRQASDAALVKAIDDLTVAYTSADALLKADIDSLSDKLSTLEQTVNEADDALQEAIDKVKEELSAAIENLRQASDEALVKAIDDLTVAYTSADALLKADIDSLSEKLTALGQTMSEAYDVLLATIEQVQADLDATKKELENTIAEDMAQLNNKIDTMNAALDAAYKLADEMLKKDIEALLDKLEAAHNKDIDALRAELEADYMADIDALRAELEALKVQISEQDDTNSAAIQTLKSVDSTQKEATDIFRNITIVGLCIGSVSLLGNAILLILQLKKKYLK